MNGMLLNFGFCCDVHLTFLLAATLVIFDGRCNVEHTLNTIELQWVHAEADELYHDLRVALDVIGELSESSATRQTLIEAMLSFLALFVVFCECPRVGLMTVEP